MAEQIARMERATLSRVLPFGTYVFYLVLASFLTKLGMSADELRWLYPVKIALVIAVLWAMRDQYSELSMPRENAMVWVIAVLAGLFVFVAWINLNGRWMVLGASPGFDPRGEGGALDWFLVAVRLIGATLVVPVMEELFWRSFLLRWIVDEKFMSVQPSSVGWKAFAIVAVFFALEHNLWLAGLLAGVVYNLLYIRSKTLWPPIVAHAVTNGVLGIWVIMTGNWAYW
jgi:CAAX prenyl protease-like protein